MNKHLFIAFMILAMMAGVGSFVYIIQDYRKNRLPFLRNYLAFIFFYNFFVSVLFTYHYMEKNIFSGGFIEFARHSRLVILLVGLLLGSVFAYSLSFVRAALQLNSKTISRRFTPLFSIAAIPPLGVILFLIFFHPPSGDVRWLTIAQSWMLAMNIMLASFNLVTWARNAWEKGDPFGIRSFSLLYLAAFMLSIADMASDAFFQVKLPIYTFIISLLFMNLSGLIWFIFIYCRKRSPLAREGLLKDNFERWCTQNQISPREREIVELILQGKQNIEISDILYLSLPTIKTYLYRLYKKVKIRNRTELIKRIMTE